MNASACIPETDLAQFIRGQLESDRLGEIAEHVDSCEALPGHGRRLGR